MTDLDKLIEVRDMLIDFDLDKYNVPDDIYNIVKFNVHTALSGLYFVCGALTEDAEILAHIRKEDD